MYILGISAYFHDSAACLLCDGVIVAAAQEERFTRKKHDASFPRNAIEYCLKEAGITMDNVDYIGFYEKPHLKFERILKNYANFFPKGFATFKLAVPSWARTKLWTPAIIKRRILDMTSGNGKYMSWDGCLIFPEHHMSHAASAYFPSPFNEAAILTLDGVGEWSSTTLAVGKLTDRGVPQIEFLKEMRYPHSLGMLYSAFTGYLGFKVNSGEYKVMGLAPYGEPKYVDLILKHLVDLKEDGSYQLSMDYFSFPYDAMMTNERFHTLFGMPPRTSETDLTQEHFDIAASLQQVIELAVLHIAKHLHEITGMSKLVMAGGVALNCVANGRLLREGPFDDIWIQPAAGDAGGSLGTAYYIWHQVLNQRKVSAKTDPNKDLMQGAYLGPEFTETDIKAALEKRGLKYQVLDRRGMVDHVANLLANEHVVGWFQGRMEFGPRALGARSILGDPRSKTMQSTMNLKIKFRESFRPFAPVVLRERVLDYFELPGRPTSILGSPTTGYDSPYMLLVGNVNREKCMSMTDAQKALFGIEKLNVIRSEIPSCTHVDYSARVQTIAQNSHPAYYNLIKAFESKTGVPVLVNTSFNVRGEPIVCTPDDAINCFLGTAMDALVMENVIVMKSDVPASMALDYKHQFQLD